MELLIISQFIKFLLLFLENSKVLSGFGDCFFKVHDLNCQLRARDVRLGV